MRQRQSFQTPGDRFDAIAKSAAQNKCWPWTGTLDALGYGRVYINSRDTYAHRFVYERINGVIPINLCVLHKCDNPPCVNPDHLFLGTHFDNMADKKEKGRCSRLRGETNKNAKLTEHAIEQILNLRLLKVSGKEIAKQFGVTPGAISHIFTGRTWSWKSTN